MKIKSFGCWLAGGVALVTGWQQFWCRRQYFFSAVHSWVISAKSASSVVGAFLGVHRIFQNQVH
jgi:hypothetical protein